MSLQNPCACSLRAIALAGIGLAVASLALAQANSSAPQPFVEEQRRQERERALRAQQEPSVDARLEAPAPVPPALLPRDETPCFRIDQVRLTGERSEDFQWSLEALSGPDGKDSPIGRCLGTEGVNVVLARAQQAVIARGYVTTRVLASAQDLTQGSLTLSLIPGRIAAIRMAAGNPADTSLQSAIPMRQGDLLNIRAIEQGLENLKRVPTAEADIQIEPSTAPGARPGDSDLVVRYRQAMPLRTTLSLDDGGTDATGRLQAGFTLAWDNPLGLNDLFYASLNHDAFNHGGQGTGGQTVHYSLPFGDWLLSATASRSDYHQTVAGLLENYVYAGETDNAELRLSRLLLRDRSRKTTLNLRGWRRASRNYIDDTEVEVQQRRVGGWELGLNHREFIGAATLDANLAYRRGTGAFGSLPAPEEIDDEGSSRMQLWIADAALNLPFEIGGQRLRYSGLWRAQWNRTPLTPQDRFSIGGRYTVRGFDGESSLLGDRGWLVRNDIGWALGDSGAELYAGIDYGRVGGPSTKWLLGDQLAGGVLGLRGAWRRLNCDFFVGTPISKPEGFQTANLTAGFGLIFSF